MNTKEKFILWYFSKSILAKRDGGWRLDHRTPVRYLYVFYVWTYETTPYCSSERPSALADENSCFAFVNNRLSNPATVSPIVVRPFIWEDFARQEDRYRSDRHSLRVGNKHGSDFIDEFQPLARYLTWACFINMSVRGMRTWSNFTKPLSIASKPNVGPMSPRVIPERTASRSLAEVTRVIIILVSLNHLDIAFPLF